MRYILLCPCLRADSISGCQRSDSAGIDGPYAWIAVENQCNEPACLERNYAYSILKSSNPFYGGRIPPQSGQFPAEMDRTIPAGEPRAFPLPADPSIQEAESLAAVSEDGMRHDAGAYQVAFLSSEKKSERGSQP